MSNKSHAGGNKPPAEVKKEIEKDAEAQASAAAASPDETTKVSPPAQDPPAAVTEDAEITKRAQTIEQRQNDLWREADQRAQGAEAEAKRLREEADRLRPQLNRMNTSRPAAAIYPDEETVTMVFPRPVLLTDSKGNKVQFTSGIQEVPQSLAEHPYLRDCGVKAHRK